MTKRGVSKSEWLAAGLEALRTGGVESITVHRLARILGISKSGFYWHFKDRDDLLLQMLDCWLHEVNLTILTDRTVLELPALERLEAVATRLVDHEGTDYEISFREWALQDARAARVVKAVDDMRVDFVRRAFAELGFSGQELEMRTLLFTCYHTWEASMLASYSRHARLDMVPIRIRLLASDLVEGGRNAATQSAADQRSVEDGSP